MKDRLTTAPLPLDRPQGSCGTLNARSAIGKASWPLEQSLWLYLERPQGYWNAPWRIRNARRAILYCLLAGRDKSLYYLRPNPLRSPPLRPLERAKRYWNGLRPLGTPAGG